MGKWNITIDGESIHDDCRETFENVMYNLNVIIDDGEHFHSEVRIFDPEGNEHDFTVNPQTIELKSRVDNKSIIV